MFVVSTTPAIFEAYPPYRVNQIQTSYAGVLISP